MFNLFKTKTFLEIAVDETNKGIANKYSYQSLKSNLGLSDKLLVSLNQYLQDRHTNSTFDNKTAYTMIILDVVEFIKDKFLMYISLGYFTMIQNDWKTAFEFYSLAYSYVDDTNDEPRILIAIAHVLKISFIIKNTSSNEFLIKSAEKAYSEIILRRYDRPNYCFNLDQYYTWTLLSAATYFGKEKDIEKFKFYTNRFMQFKMDKFENVPDLLKNYLKDNIDIYGYIGSINNYKTLYESLLAENLID